MRGRDEFENGELIRAAEQAGFEVLVQNLTGRKTALVVLEHSQWPMVNRVAGTIVAAIDAPEPGSYVEVAVPFKE